MLPRASRALIAAALLLPVWRPAVLADQPAAPTPPSAGATATGPAEEGASAETRAEAMRLIETMHSEANAAQTLSLMRGVMVQMILKANPAQPKDKVENTVDEVLLPELQAHKHELIAVIAEVYAQRFTADELRELRHFYEQPLGQKMIKMQPQIAREMFGIGQAWGGQVARDALRKHADELHARGLNI